MTSGLRTTEEQQYLYAQGRTRPGNKVTWADGILHKSQHQFGIAIDIGFRGDNLYPKDANGGNDMVVWRNVATVANEVGLNWAFDDWGFDLPHFMNLTDEPETTFLEKVRRKMNVEFDYSVYEKAEKEYGISKQVLFCMSGPETSYAKSMKSKMNLVNIGNSDRGDTRDFESYEDNVMKTAKELHEGQYLAPLTKIGELSCAGRIKDLGWEDCDLPDTPVRATDPENRDGHMDTCLSYVFDETKSRHNYNYKQ